MGTALHVSRRTRRRLGAALTGVAAVVALLATGPGAVAAPAAAAPTTPPARTAAPGPGVAAPDTSFRYVSTPGDYVGQGGREVLDTDQGDTVTVTGTRTVLHLEAASAAGDSSWSVFLAAGVGDTLHPGTYRGAERWPFQSGRAPALDMSGNGRGCNTVAGSFRIDQIAFTAAGAPRLVDVTFVEHCEGAKPAVTGTIHLAAQPLGYVQSSDTGDYVGGGVTKTYLGGTSLFGVSGDATRFSARVSGLGDDWSVSAAAPAAQSFVVGQSYPTTRFGDAGTAALDVTGDGRGCNTSRGRLTVTALTVVRGTVTHLAATWVQHCEGATPALRGTLHYYA